ncbi:unnamed protein product, partial [Ectocarpus sp. 13 AM-2016]
QVNNAIVRSVLQGCSALRQLYLVGCRHVTDAGFHLQQSPFYVLLGAVSLETISVQGCPQVGVPVCCAVCCVIFFEVQFSVCTVEQSVIYVCSRSRLSSQNRGVS